MDSLANTLQGLYFDQYSLKANLSQQFPTVFKVVIFLIPNEMAQINLSSTITSIFRISPNTRIPFLE